MNIINFKYWWLITLKGFAILLFGILTFVFPIETAESLLIIFAFLIGTGGGFALAFAIKNHSTFFKIFFLLEGLVDIGTALLILFYPYKSAIFFSIVLGVWLLFNAPSNLLVARNRYKTNSEWKMPLFNGLLTLVLSMMIILHPIVGMLTFTFLLSSTAILCGAFLIYISLRWWRHEISHHRHTKQ